MEPKANSAHKSTNSKTNNQVFDQLWVQAVLVQTLQLGAIPKIKHFLSKQERKLVPALRDLSGFFIHREFDQCSHLTG